MRQAALKEILEEEPRSYVERIRELVERDRVDAARKLVAEAVAKGVQEEKLRYWQEVLAPAKILGTSPADEPDRTEDFRWLDAHWQEHRGQWVALFGGRLLAHGDSLGDVLALLKSTGQESRPGRRALVHYIS